uniref:RNase H type-1 domain-containing protein n=1 Tax=Trichogramma kaykai TaxID=54128 RepID=A0ABD2XIC6_9HYME
MLEPSRTPRSTIPRLELRAALIAARLLRTICDELAIDINTCVAWSDSRIVLHWIDSTEAIGNSVVDG